MGAPSAQATRPVPAPARHPLHGALVRIRASSDDAVVGVGFLVGPDLVCTCAHVVCQALGVPEDTPEKPTMPVRLDFPFLGNPPVEATVETWLPAGATPVADVAVLRLSADEPGPAEARPARLWVKQLLAGRQFQVCGFPTGNDAGAWARGVFDERNADQTVQIEGVTTTGYRIQPGFSGAPVWDIAARAVAGMVVASERDELTKVAVAIPSDVLASVAPAIEIAAPSDPYAALTDGVLTSLSALERYLRNYLGTAAAPAIFGGRAEQLRELDAWLDAPDPPCAVMVARAGRGKSALLTSWAADVALEGRAVVALVPVSLRFGTAMQSKVLSLLGERLAFLYGDIADATDQDAMRTLIQRYLRRDRDPGDPPLVVVVDGADEAAGWRLEDDPPFPAVPGRGVKIIISARPLGARESSGWIEALEWTGMAKALELPPLDHEGVADIVGCLPRLGAALDESLVTELVRLSEGDPLLVSLYLNALLDDDATTLSSADLKELKPGLGGYFERWWTEQERQWGSEGRDSTRENQGATELLNACAMALGPLPRDALATIAALPSGLDLRRKLGEVSRLVIETPLVSGTTGFVFSHPKLTMFFQEQLTEEERRRWRERFLSFCRDQAARLDDAGEHEPVSPYALMHYGAHLEEAGDTTEELYALTARSWQTAWEALEGAYDGFLEDVGRAWTFTDIGADPGAPTPADTERRGRAVSAQCRCALIVSSIQSVASNIETELLAALVREGVRSPEWAVALASRTRFGSDIAEALVTLGPDLRGLQDRVLGVIRTLAEPDRRSMALAGLAPYLSAERFHDAVAAEFTKFAHGGLEPQSGWAIRSSDEALASVLRDLAPVVPDDLLPETLGWLDRVSLLNGRWDGLAAIAPRLDEAERVRRVGAEVDALDEMEVGRDGRVTCLARLAPYAGAPKRAELIRRVLIDVGELDNPWTQVDALAQLAAHAEGDEIGAAIQVSAGIEPARFRSTALTALATVPSKFREQAVDGALSALDASLDDAAKLRPVNDFDAGQLEYAAQEDLAQLAPNLTDERMQAAIAVASRITAARTRAEALSDLAAHADGDVRVRTVTKALSAALKLDRDWQCARAISTLPPQLPEPQLKEAFAAARSLYPIRSRAVALTALSEHVPRAERRALLEEALADSRVIDDEPQRLAALNALVERLSPPHATSVIEAVVKYGLTTTDDEPPTQ